MEEECQFLQSRVIEKRGAFGDKEHHYKTIWVCVRNATKEKRQIRAHCCDPKRMCYVAKRG